MTKTGNDGLHHVQPDVKPSFVHDHELQTCLVEALHAEFDGGTKVATQVPRPLAH
jgi:hypothetical protein